MKQEQEPVELLPYTRERLESNWWDVHGVVAHTADNPTRRYFSPGSGHRPKAFRQRSGPDVSFDDLIDPRIFKPGCGVHP